MIAFEQLIVHNN